MPVKAAASAALGVTIDASRISRLFKSKTPSGFRRITDPSLVAAITGSTTTCGESIRASASHTMPTISPARTLKLTWRNLPGEERSSTRNHSSPSGRCKCCDVYCFTSRPTI